jgi:hypothetical protein
MTDMVKVELLERSARELTKRQLKTVVAGVGTNGEIHIGST